MSAHEVARLFASEAGIRFQTALDFVEPLELTMPVVRSMYRDALASAFERMPGRNVRDTQRTFFFLHLARHVCGGPVTPADVTAYLDGDGDHEVRITSNILFEAIRREVQREELLAAGISDVPVGDA